MRASAYAKLVSAWLVWPLAAACSGNEGRESGRAGTTGGEGVARATGGAPFGGATSGRVEGPGDVRIAARTEFANSSDITLSNLTLVNTALNESPCGDNTVLSNNAFQSSTDNHCD